MTLDPTVPPAGEGTPTQEGGEQPAAGTVTMTPEEIRKMVSDEANALVDARIPGLQSAYEKQISGLRKELKAAQADPDGYVGSETSEEAAELARVQRENEALRAGRQYPDVYPLYEAMLSASTAEEQLQTLEDFRKALTTRQGSAAPAQDQQQQNAGQEPSQGQPAPPPVDPNRPLSRPPVVAGDGMNRELADQIIDSLGNEPGSWPSWG